MSVFPYGLFAAAGVGCMLIAMLLTAPKRSFSKGTVKACSQLFCQEYGGSAERSQDPSQARGAFLSPLLQPFS